VNATVLGDAALGDVHLRHDLEAGDQGCVDMLGQLEDVMQDAVDAEADPDLVHERLDVDVTGAFLDGALENDFGDADDGSLVGYLGDGVHGHAALALLIVVVGEHARVAYRVRELLHVDPAEGACGRGRLLRRTGTGTASGPSALEGVGDGHPDAFWVGEQGLDVLLQVDLEVVRRHDVGGLGHCHPHTAIAPGVRDGPVALGDVLGDEGRHSRVGWVVSDVHVRDTKLLGQRLVEGVALHMAQIDQYLSYQFGGLSLDVEGRVELVLGDETLLNEHLADSFPSDRPAHRLAPLD